MYTPRKCYALRRVLVRYFNNSHRDFPKVAIRACKRHQHEREAGNGRERVSGHHQRETNARRPHHLKRPGCSFLLPPWPVIIIMVFGARIRVVRLSTCTN